MPFRGAKRSINASFDKLKDEVGFTKTRSTRQAPASHRASEPARRQDGHHAPIDLSDFLCDPCLDQHPPPPRLPLRVLGAPQGKDVHAQAQAYSADQEAARYEMRMAEREVELEAGRARAVMDTDVLAEACDQQSPWFASSQPAQPYPLRPGRSPSPASSQAPPRPFSRNPKRPLLQNDDHGESPSSSPVVLRPFGKRVARPALDPSTKRRPVQRVSTEEYFQDDAWENDEEISQALHAAESMHNQSQFRVDTSRHKQEIRTPLQPSSPPYHARQPFVAVQRKRPIDLTVFGKRVKKVPVPVPAEAMQVKQPEHVIDDQVNVMTSSEGPATIKSSHLARKAASSIRESTHRQDKLEQASSVSLNRQVEKSEIKEAAQTPATPFFSDSGIFVPSWAQLPDSSEAHKEVMTKQRSATVEAFFLQASSDTDEEDD